MYAYSEAEGRSDGYRLKSNACVVSRKRNVKWNRNFATTLVFREKGQPLKAHPNFWYYSCICVWTKNLWVLCPNGSFPGFFHRFLCYTPKNSRGSSTSKPFKFTYKMLYRGVNKRFSFNLNLLLVSSNPDGEDDSDSDSEMETDPLQVGRSTVCSWKHAPIAVNLRNWNMLDLTSTSRASRYSINLFLP